MNKNETDAAWRAVSAAYAARTTGLPVNFAKPYDGPVDVAAFVAAAALPSADTPAAHARAWRDLRASFALQFGGGLFSDAAA